MLSFVPVSVDLAKLDLAKSFSGQPQTSRPNICGWVDYDKNNIFTLHAEREKHQAQLWEDSCHPHLDSFFIHAVGKRDPNLIYLNATNKSQIFTRNWMWQIQFFKSNPGIFNM